MDKKALEEALKDYEDLWGAAKDDYMLSGDSEESIREGSCSIVNMDKGMVMIIENGEVAWAVKQKMLEAGVRIGNSADPQVRKDYIKHRLKSARRA